MNTPKARRSDKLIKLKTRGLLTIPTGLPGQMGHYKYEFNHGVYKGSQGYESCSWGDFTTGTLSRPNIVITNIFMDRL